MGPCKKVKVEEAANDETIVPGDTEKEKKDEEDSIKKDDEDTIKKDKEPTQIMINEKETPLTEIKMTRI